MSRSQFESFMATAEGESRKGDFFLIPQEDERDAAILAECDKERIPKWKAEQNRREYLERTLSDTGYTIVSLHDPVNTDSEPLTFEDVVSDVNQPGVEEIVMASLEKQALYRALSQLSEKELLLIEALYFKDPPLTEEECAKMLNQTQPATNLFKARVLAKLKAIMENKKWRRKRRKHKT